MILKIIKKTCVLEDDLKEFSIDFVFIHGSVIVIHENKDLGIKSSEIIKTLDYSNKTIDNRSCGLEEPIKEKPKTYFVKSEGLKYIFENGYLMNNDGSTVEKF